MNKKLEAVVEELTVDDLKELAATMGYKVSKKPDPMPKILPCICGRKTIATWYAHDGFFYRCADCGKNGEKGINKRKARENWNKMIEEERCEQ